MIVYYIRTIAAYRAYSTTTSYVARKRAWDVNIDWQLCIHCNIQKFGNNIRKFGNLLVRYHPSLFVLDLAPWILYFIRRCVYPWFRV